MILGVLLMKSGEKWIKPIMEWKTESMGSSSDGTTFKVNDNFFVKVKKVE